MQYQNPICYKISARASGNFYGTCHSRGAQPAGLKTGYNVEQTQTQLQQRLQPHPMEQYSATAANIQLHTHCPHTILLYQLDQSTLANQPLSTLISLRDANYKGRQLKRRPIELQYNEPANQNAQYVGQQRRCEEHTMQAGNQSCDPMQM